MEDFRRKDRLVAGGHVTEALVTITYVRVVLRETVSIDLIFASLNEFPIKVAETHNAYITFTVTEKI